MQPHQHQNADAHRTLEQLDRTDLRIALFIIRLYVVRRWLINRLRWITVYPAPVTFLFGVFSHQWLLHVGLTRIAALGVATVIACGTAALVYAADDISNECSPPPRKRADRET